jgi:uncharacterized protein YqgC (DUF456 family)
MTTALVAVAIVVGLLGTIVPVLPGALLVAGAILVWAVATGGTTAWVVALSAVAVIGLGQVLKYAVVGKQVVGLVVGFVAGVFLAEAGRLRTFTDAWPTTVQAMKSAGWSVLIEFGSCLIAAGFWTGAVVALV